MQFLWAAILAVAPPPDEGHWAFRAPSRPAVPRFSWGHTPIDAFIAAEHDKRGLKPSPPAPKHVLLRRVHLDLIGLPPTPVELRAFLKDSSKDAFEKIVDRLLDSPHYGERWGRHWMDVWRYADPNSKKPAKGLRISPHMWRWRDWIIDSLNADVGYDRMVQEMLAGDELEPEALVATAYLGRNTSSSRDAWLHDTVDHAAQGFLGVTLQCARCHDHPVDPIKQTEYYRVRAIFEPLKIKSDKKAAGLTRAYDGNPNEKTYLYVRGNELTPDKSSALSPGVPAALGGSDFDVMPVGKSSGRRLALARWITDPRNPLAARVAVNHVWMRHFGRPLVETVNDFGLGGARPTHRALLDWLSVDLIEGRWKMKRLHRLIVTSAAYRMDSRPDAAQLKKDPDDRYVWRMPPRRMEAEAVRDSILHVSGRLDVKRGKLPLDPSKGDSVPQRSLYFLSSPYVQMTFLRTFDGAPVQECYRRTESIQPTQALALLNSRLALESAERLSADLEKEPDFVASAFERVLCRPATDEEAKICREFLEKQSRDDLVHLLFNHHDFVTIR